MCHRLRTFHIILMAGFSASTISQELNTIDKLNKPSPWDFCISKVQRVEVSDVDRLTDPRCVAKWIVFTRLTNKSRDNKLILTVPYYGATVRNKVELDSFLSGSKWALKDKKNDFMEVRPHESIEARHIIYARSDEFGEKFSLHGHFDGNETVAEEPKANNFAADWSLYKTPVEKEFSISITLCDRVPFEARKLLGDDYAKLWHGQALITKGEKLKISGTLDTPKK